MSDDCKDKNVVHIKTAYPVPNTGTCDADAFSVLGIIGNPNRDATVSIDEYGRVKIVIVDSIRTVTYLITPINEILKIETLLPLGIKERQGNNGEIYILPTHLN